MGKGLGFSVRIFIPTGEPEGLRVIEKSNWTGQGLFFPRAICPEVRVAKAIGFRLSRVMETAIAQRVTVLKLTDHASKSFIMM